MNRSLTFGQVIKGCRETHGWTQEQLGLITKLAKRTIQRIENDEHSPSDTTIMALANAFETSFECMKELAKRPEEMLAYTEQYFKNIAWFPQLISGHELVRIISNIDAATFDNGQLEDIEEAELVGKFLQDISDFSEIWDDIEIIERARTEIQFDEYLQELDVHGFWVFGMIKRQNLYFQDTKELCPLNVGYVFVIRKSNPNIVKSEDGKQCWPAKVEFTGLK